MDNKMDTPTITSLVVNNEPPDPWRPKPTPPWKAPFLELLGLLKVIDNSHPTPKVDDQRFCIQPSHDLSEISRIFLSVSTSSPAQYDIDIKTIQLLGSDAIPPVVNKLQEYANHVLRRTQLFRDRLLERDVIKDSTCFLHVDLFTCPLCRNPLVSCVDCDSKVACSRPTCLGSLDCELCHDHKRMSCHSCIAKNDPVPSLICCPVCEDWCCREDTEWCAGLILHPALGTEELAELSRECKWDSETIVRSHPPKPGPCMFCTVYASPQSWTRCRNSEDSPEPDCCPSRTPLMTRHRLRVAFCPECFDRSTGCRCACQIGWICDTCSAIKNKSSYPILIACPRCGVRYCHGPNLRRTCGDYIDTCRGCEGVILCEDCQEEEELPGETQNDKEHQKQVVFVAQCNFCEAWGCPDCHASERTATCLLCDEWFCYNCISDPECNVMERCPFCNGDICRYCRIDHQDCPGAVMIEDGSPSPYLGTS